MRLIEESDPIRWCAYRGNKSREHGAGVLLPWVISSISGRDVATSRCLCLCPVLALLMTLATTPVSPVSYDTVHGHRHKGQTGLTSCARLESCGIHAWVSCRHARDHSRRWMSSRVATHHTRLRHGLLDPTRAVLSNLSSIRSLSSCQLSIDGACQSLPPS